MNETETKTPAKQPWQRPTLTALGDLETLTALGPAAGGDASLNAAS